MTWNRPEMSMFQLIVKKMIPPTRIMRYCCEYLKEQGGKNHVVVTGIRWAESSRRSKRRMVETCMRDSKKMYFHPIIEWSDSDVWQYIRENNLPYCCLYDEGFKRIGCVGCPMSVNRAKEFERWPKFEKMYRRAFDRAVQASDLSGLTTKRLASSMDGHVKWDTGTAMFDWWMEEKHLIKDPYQLVLFE